MKYFLSCAILLALSCSDAPADKADTFTKLGQIKESDTPNMPQDYAQQIPFDYNVIKTGTTSPQELLEFANSLQGIPYKYGSVDPAVGFDCSGFITYVFNHFKIAVPRSSESFTNVEEEIDLSRAQPGDIILYTGTDSTVKTVGHMGIIMLKDSTGLQFIHSTSGKANGVTITQLNNYYMSRFVKVIRIFGQNNEH